MGDKTLRAGWQLLVRVEVDKSRRVQCQCRACGKTVYADIHIVRWPDGEIACWGSRCFIREMGVAGKKVESLYNRVNGHKLTDEERDLLDANREGLIARIKGREGELLQAEKRRQEALQVLNSSSPVTKVDNLYEIARENVRQQWLQIDLNPDEVPGLIWGFEKDIEKELKRLKQANPSDPQQPKLF